MPTPYTQFRSVLAASTPLTRARAAALFQLVVLEIPLAKDHKCQLCTIFQDLPAIPILVNSDYSLLTCLLEKAQDYPSYKAKILDILQHQPPSMIITTLVLLNVLEKTHAPAPAPAPEEKITRAK